MLGARQLGRLTFGPSFVATVSDDEAEDAGRHELYLPWVERLRAVGFEPKGRVRLRRESAATAAPTLAVALRHTQRDHVWALIEPSDLVGRKMPVAIELSSLLANGVWVSSTIGKGYARMPASANHVRNDPLVGSLHALFESHSEVVLSQGSLAVTMGLAEFAEQFRVSMDRCTEGWVSEGMLVATATPERWRCSLGTALRWAARQAKEQPAYWKHIDRLAEVWETPEIPLLEEVRAFERYESLWVGRPRSQVWLAVLLVTAGVAFASFAEVLDAASAFAIGLAVGVHELGHFVAMRALGYRDTQVFFVPFLGGATTGTKPDATVAQEMAVLLAGPMPGLFLGAVLSVAAPWVGERGADLAGLATMFVAINFLNLLPVYPLDGGRIVHRLVAAGRPGLDAGFRVVAVMSFALAALTLGDWVMGMLAVVVALGIPANYRTSVLERRARQWLSGEGGTDATPVAATKAVEAAYRALRESPDLARTPARTVAMVRQLCDRLARRRASPAAAVLGFIVYGACLSVGVGALLVGAVVAHFSDPPDPLTTTELSPLACESLPSATLQAAVYECELPDAEAARMLDAEIGWYAGVSAALCGGPWSAAVSPLYPRKATCSMRVARQLASSPPITAARAAWSRSSRTRGIQPRGTAGAASRLAGLG